MTQINNPIIKKMFRIYFPISHTSQLKKESLDILSEKASSLIKCNPEQNLIEFSKNYIMAKKIAITAIYFYGLPGLLLYINTIMQSLEILHDTFYEIVECEAKQLFEVILIAQYLRGDLDVEKEPPFLLHSRAPISIFLNDKKNEIINKLELPREYVASAEKYVAECFLRTLII